MKRLLLIGGSHAGAVVEIDGKDQSISMLERIDLTSRDFSNMVDRLEAPPISPKQHIERYRIEKLFQDGKAFEVLYISQGHDLIGDLLAGYRPVTHERFKINN